MKKLPLPTRQAESVGRGRLGINTVAKEEAPMPYVTPKQNGFSKTRQDGTTIHLGNIRNTLFNLS